MLGRIKTRKHMWLDRQGQLSSSCQSRLPSYVFLAGSCMTPLVPSHVFPRVTEIFFFAKEKLKSWQKVIKAIIPRHSKEYKTRVGRFLAQNYFFADYYWLMYFIILYFILKCFISLRLWPSACWQHKWMILPCFVWSSQPYASFKQIKCWKHFSKLYYQSS